VADQQSVLGFTSLPGSSNSSGSDGMQMAAPAHTPEAARCLLLQHLLLLEQLFRGPWPLHSTMWLTGVSMLSLGEQQRLAFASCCLPRPPWHCWMKPRVLSTPPTRRCCKVGGPYTCQPGVLLMTQDEHGPACQCCSPAN